MHEGSLRGELSLCHREGLDGGQVGNVGHALQVDGGVLLLGPAQIGVQQLLHVSQLLVQLLARQLDVPLGCSNVLLGLLRNYRTSIGQPVCDILTSKLGEASDWQKDGGLT